MKPNPRGLGPEFGRQFDEASNPAQLAPEPFQQSIDDYVTSLHSRNGLSRDRMTSAEARAFDTAVRELVAPHACDGLLSLAIATHVAWGRVSSARPD